MTENDRIKKVRFALDMTMEKFGNKLGVTKVAISNIEKGNRNVTDQMRRSICREFGVNEVWLRTGEGGDENMFLNISEDDRFSLNLGKLGRTENDFVKNGINYLAEADPDKLKVVEEFMKTWLGIK